MKNIILLLAISVLGMQGCIRDTEYSLVCIYTNNTEWNLDVVSSTPDPDLVPIIDVIQEKYTLAPGESHTIRLSRRGDYPDVLCLDRINTNNNNSTTVSNGEAIVKCKESEECKLYNLSNYKFISESKGTKKYQYIFEPDFFDNAEPL